MHSPTSLSIRPSFKPRTDKKLKIKSVEFKDWIYHMEKPHTPHWWTSRPSAVTCRDEALDAHGPLVSWSRGVYSDTSVVKDAAGLLQSALVAQSRMRKLRERNVYVAPTRPSQQWALGGPWKAWILSWASQKIITFFLFPVFVPTPYPYPGYFNTFFLI